MKHVFARATIRMFVCGAVLMGVWCALFASAAWAAGAGVALEPTGLTVGTLPSEDQADGGTRLGMALVPVDNELMLDWDLLSDSGLYVSSIKKNGPADKAGILAGEVVTKANGADLVSMDDLDFVLEYRASGDTVLLEVEGNRTLRTVEVALDDLASDHEGQAERLAALAEMREPRSPSAMRRTAMPIPADSAPVEVKPGSDAPDGPAGADDDRASKPPIENSAGDEPTSGSGNQPGPEGELADASTIGGVLVVAAIAVAVSAGVVIATMRGRRLGVGCDELR